MNIKLLYWLIIGGIIMTGCVNDDTSLGGRTLSEITIESPRDTFQFELGGEVRIAPVITQSIQGQELRYEWRSRYKLKLGETGTDSLKVLPCTDAALSDLTNFRREGEYTVRLRAYNDDVSSFYYFKVFIRSTYDKGLMVLSKDENNKGRLAFLRLLNEGEVLNAETDSFRTNAFENINPEIVLEDPTDMMFWGNQKMILFAQKTKGLHFCDQSLVHLYSMSFNKTPGNLGKFYYQDKPYILIEGQGLCEIATDAAYKTPYTTVEKGCFTPQFGGGVGVDYSYYMFIDYDQSRIYNVTNNNTGDLFAAGNIVNIASREGITSLVVLTDKTDPLKVTIAFLTSDRLRLQGRSSYTSTQPLTLTKEAEIVSEGAHLNVAFYPVGADLYQWALSGNTPELPQYPVKTFAGQEITCLAISNDYRYLSIGLYDKNSEEELKGSVHIMRIEDKVIVKEFNNIADRPVKILYKENRN